MIINITMTAIRRPELHERVLKSFCEKMFYPAMEKDRTLKLYPIMHIDPIGCKNWISEDSYDILKKYFIRNITYIESNNRTAHFGYSFKEVWQESKNNMADFTFHLEDDWELLKPVDLLNLIRIMQKFPHLQIMRLNMFSSGNLVTKNWNKFIPWNGVFFEVTPPDRGLLGFTGHPSLIRQSFVNEVAPKLNPDSNPEKQIKGKNPKFKRLFQYPYTYGVWGERGKGPIVRDIGREWMIKNGYRKKGSKAYFTEYVKVKSQKRDS